MLFTDSNIIYNSHVDLPNRKIKKKLYSQCKLTFANVVSLIITQYQFTSL